LARFVAIGSPMLPRPMNAMRDIIPPDSCALYSDATVPRHHITFRFGRAMKRHEAIDFA
jgi:hypothetical protein